MSAIQKDHLGSGDFLPQEIKPIPTRYRGCFYRSRLEARWAVFFDSIGIKYLYEPEGFIIDGERYLPDFYLPDMYLWIEIKPFIPPSEEWMRKYIRFADKVFPRSLFGMIYGSPWITASGLYASDTQYAVKLFDSLLIPGGYNALFTECRKCGSILLCDSVAYHCPESRYSDNVSCYGGCCSERAGLPASEKIMLALTNASSARFERCES
jgi:hypothetical protein